MSGFTAYSQLTMLFSARVMPKYNKKYLLKVYLSSYVDLSLHSSTLDC